MANGAINPKEPLPTDDPLRAFGGPAPIGLFDPTALPLEEILSRPVLRKLEKKGVDTSKEIRLDELRETLRSLGIEPKQLGSEFRKALKSADILGHKGQLASQSQLERLTAGTRSSEEIAATREGATNILAGGQGAVEAGLAIMQGQFGSEAAQQTLRGVNEMFGNQLAAMGLGTNVTSGGAAFQQTALGLQALAGFGMQQIAGGQAGIGAAYSLDPFLNPEFTLGRADLGYQRNLFDFQFQKMLEMQHRAKQFLTGQAWWDRIGGYLGSATLGGGTASSGIFAGAGSPQGAGAGAGASAGAGWSPSSGYVPG